MIKSGVAASSAAVKSKNDLSTSSLKSVASRGAVVQTIGGSKDRSESGSVIRTSSGTNYDGRTGKPMTKESFGRTSSTESLTQIGQMKKPPIAMGQFVIPENVSKSVIGGVGSKVRKRSRIGNEETLSDMEEDKYKDLLMDELLQQLEI